MFVVSDTISLTSWDSRSLIMRPGFESHYEIYHEIERLCEILRLKLNQPAMAGCQGNKQLSGLFGTSLALNTVYRCSLDTTRLSI
jgi:hypothetical protein